MSSDGPAATIQDVKMGVFLKEERQQYNNRPVYQKVSGGQYFYYRDSGYWGMGSTLGGGVGIVFVATPPSTGAEYVDGEWKYDPQLTVSGEAFNNVW